MPAKIGGIENQENRIGARKTVHFSEQDVVSDALVFGPGVQAVDARQIDHEDVAIFDFYFAEVMLHRNAGKIRDLLTQSSEAIEERRFSGVGWADDGHDVSG